MSDETAFEKPATLGQLKEIIATLVQAIPAQLSSDDAQRIIEEKRLLVSEVQKVFAWRRVQEQFDLDAHLAKARADMMIRESARGTAVQIEEWAQFYRAIFDLNVHYSEVNIPARPSGFYRLIVVAQGLTLKRIIEVARKHFPVDLGGDSRRYFSTDEETRGTHDRLPTQSYCVWVRDRIDPDEEYVYVRPGVLARDGVKCITLLEHLLFHLKYFRETGKFLDRNARQTLYAGSHYSDGGVVAVFVDKSHSHETCIGIRVGFNKGPYSTRKVNA